MACRAAILAVAAVGALALAACETKPPMTDGVIVNTPSGHYSLCRNNPESVWCKK